MTMTLSGTGGASLATNGYCYLPNGLILQWGTVSLNANASTAITFPVAFPNACAFVNGISNYAGADYAVTTTAKSNTGATFYRQGSAITGNWFAIGY